METVIKPVSILLVLIIVPVLLATQWMTRTALVQYKVQTL